ncbi:MAG: pseudouridine synthase [Bryobacteraceae bacterium]|nr:pseudouridine synthase [Bryobacteraceae bacterium]
MAVERLQKIIAGAGLASRRKAEELITGGDVTVNGKVVTALGTKADLERDHIKVFGKLLKPPAHMVYLALNKPDGCVTTVSDPEGRPTVMEYVRGVKDRVYPVGRLDYHSEGLLLFTNDGEFANRITSAKFHVQKTYLVKANGNLTVEQQEKFRAGLPISGKRTAPAEIRLHKPGVNPWYEVKLTEGRQNQIRLMFRHLGKLVERLRRVRIGFLELGKLKTGTWRPLTEQEVHKLRKQVGLKEGGEGFIQESRTPYATEADGPFVAPPSQVKSAEQKAREAKARADKYRRPKFLAPKPVKPEVEAPPVPARKFASKNRAKPAPFSKPASKPRAPFSSGPAKPFAKPYATGPGAKGPGAQSPGPRSPKPTTQQRPFAKKRSFSPKPPGNRNRPR